MATRGVIFDSNVWIGYFNIEDTTHDQAVTYFKRYERNSVILTEYVLLEVATVLKQKIGYTATSNIIAAILQTENIQLLPSTDFFSSTLTTFLELEDDSLSFVDVSLLALSTDFTVVTFDKKLALEVENRTPA